MNKIMRLVRVQLWAVLGDVLSIGAGKKRSSKVIYGGVALFTLVIGGVSFIYSLMIGTGLKLYDSIDLLPSLMMAATCIVLLLTTTFQIKGTIFGFKDYDMVMSLPISTAGIVASRIIILYAVNIIFVAVIMIPMVLAYGILVNPTPLFYLYSIVAMFILPLVPIILASVLGTLIAYVASRFRFSNLLSIVLTMGIIVAFIGSSFTIKDDGQALVNMGKAMTEQVNSLYPLARLYTETVVGYQLSSFLLFTGISVLSFALYVILVKSVFKKINTSLMTGSYRRKYKLGRLKTSSPFMALYRKELKRYFASTVYVVNTAFGVVILTVGTIAILFIDISKYLDGVPRGILAAGIPVLIGFCVCMTSTTMASISLEGKSFWILKSLPLRPQTVFHAKIAVNLTILSPLIIDVLIIGAVLCLDIFTVLLILVMTVMLAVFVALYGMVINLLMPNFNWSNETVVVKQSAASMIVIFTGMGLVGIQAAVLFLIPSVILSYVAFTIFAAIVDLILYLLLQGYGVRRYAALAN
jgi:ABC-2 type transport system permease protein